MPLNIQLPVGNWGNTIILSAYSVSNGCSFLGQASCSIEPTPTPSPFYCNYTAIQPTDAWTYGDTITILDCNGVTSAFTATSNVIQYLCVQSATGNASYEILDDYLGSCIEIAGEWYPENPVGSPTPTPTNAVTPTPSPTDPLYITEAVEYQYQAITNSSLGVKLQIGLLDYTIDWGDGNTSAYTTSNQVISHTYSSPSSGYIKISGNTINNGQLPGIYNTTFFDNGVNLTGFTSEIGKLIDLYDLSAEYFITGDILGLSACTSLINIFTKNNNINGNISDLPISARFVTIIGNNTLEGDLSSLPTYIIDLAIWGNNTISGNTSYLTSYNYLNNLSINGFNTLSGNCSSLTGITSVQIEGYNTISGNIVFGPNTEYYYLNGYNTIGGLLADSQPSHMNSLIEMIIDGYNTINGSFAGFMMPTEIFALGGNNTMSGNTSAIALNQTIGIFRLYNIPTVTFDSDIEYSTTGNTLTGPLSSFQSATSLGILNLEGNNTVSGGLNDVFSPDVYIISTGNTVNTASNWLGLNNWTGNNRSCDIRLYTQSTTNLTASEVNGLFADLVANLPLIAPIPNTYIVIKGSHAAPTGQGITDKNTLQTRSAYISTN